MDWARANDHILFTHDLDFGAMLALTNAQSPSAIQLRTQDVSPAHLGEVVIGYCLRMNRNLRLTLLSFSMKDVREFESCL